MAEENEKDDKNTEESPKVDDKTIAPEEQVVSNASIRKPRVIIIAIIIIVVLVGAGGAFLLLSKNNNEEATSAITQEKALQKSRNQLQQVIFIDLKDFIVNLNSSGNQSSFLKMSVSLEVGNLEDEKIVKANMPKIRDSFQLYLRQLRPDDLRGSAGLFRLREELLLRINKIMYPASIKDILFNELIIQ